MQKATLLILLLLLNLTKTYCQEESEIIAHYIKDHPVQSSIYLVRNDSVLADINSDRVMPLASTVKILIAIEYAKQVSKGIINPQEMIDSTELDHYYIPFTDGGAQPNWLKSMQQKQVIQGGKIPLVEVAKGMIKYSSNANTEYLIERLGWKISMLIFSKWV
ncbi:MAG: serine hydrolase [Bacteroidota bacterium]